MRGFGAVVLTQPTMPMTIAESKFVKRGGVRLKAVGDDAFWFDALISEQAFQRI